MNDLRQALDEYLAVRRALGYQLREVGSQLRKFVSFLEQRDAVYITRALTLRWIEKQDVLRSTKADRLGFVRRFAQYRSVQDPRTQIPAQELIPHCYRRKPPYIYTDTEIVRLLEAAAALPSRNRLRAHTYTTLFGLLAVTGMRISEVVALDREHVNLADGILAIRNTKFHKSRLVPIHATTCRRLDQYERQRERIHPAATDPSFFLSDRGTRLTENIVQHTFRKLSRETGLRGPSDHHGPRIHDLRHRFAVKTLLNWYRAGVDVEQHLPELATFLGHAHVADTYWYLTATPELLRLAAGRLDQGKGGTLS